jgi:chromosome partitioning protein
VIQTIAVINTKGGVGKSTAVAALAELISTTTKQRVLVVDLDPQANASLVLAGVEKWGQSRQANKTVDAFFDDLIWQRGQPQVSDYIVKGVSDISGAKIDILITTPEFRYTEREAIEHLVDQGFKLNEVRQRIANAVRRVRDQSQSTYGYMIVDCPPGISYFAEAALLIADLVVAPTIPDIMSQFGLELFIRRVLKPLATPPLLQRAPLPAERLCVLISKFDQEMQIHRVEFENIRTGANADHPYTCLPDPVPQDQDVARAAEFSEIARTLDQKYGRALPAYRNAANYIVRTVTG